MLAEMTVTAPAMRPREATGLEAGFAGIRSLASWLEKAAEHDPDRVILQDPSGREAWCGRNGQELRAGETWRKVRRLAAHLAALGLPAGARLGICLPSGSEACLSIMATEHAGLVPCLMEAGANARTLSAAIEAADMRAVITQGILGDDRPAEKLCLVAAGLFRLRFLLAFGPGVPEGVYDLDAVLSARHEPLGRRAPDPRDAGFVTFQRSEDGGAAVPIFRTRASLVAATASFLLSAEIRAGDRVHSLLPADHLRGLATGLAASLLAGATFEPHGIFDADVLAETATRPGRLHLVAPGWCEAALAAFRPALGGGSLILVHNAPTRLDPTPNTIAPVTDVLSLGEAALLSARRPEPGRIGIRFDDPSVGPDELQVASLDEDGSIRLAGVAASCADVSRGRSADADPNGASGVFRAKHVDGQLVEVT